MNPFRLFAILGLGFSSAVLVASYAAIAAYTSRPWLWPVIVHESGDRTLLQTILYYEHAARELPLDIVLGVAIGGGAVFAFPASRGTVRSGRLAAFAWALLAVCVLIVVATWWTGGIPMLGENLLQYPTRPGSPLVWGGHWRYHFLSHVCLMLVGFGLAGAVMLAARRTAGARRGLTIFGAALAAFATLTLIFVPGVESFTDPIFLGHQAREAFTHLFVTIPMGWGVCLLLARPAWGDRRAGTVPIAVALVAAAAGVLCGLFLLVGAVTTSAASQGQSESVAVLIFPHFFEHAFSYVVATLTAGLVFEWGMSADQPA